MNHVKNLTIKGKKYHLPIYLPDATRAVVRSLDTNDLRNTKIEGMVVNTFHLMTEPGASVVEKLGGVKKMMNWDGLVISDSGGFQVLSLIYQDQSLGKINDDGVIFYKTIKGQKRKYNLTPEKSIQVQFSLGSDIVICLDDVPQRNAGYEYIKKATLRTIEWAKRCKVEFQRQIKNRRLDDKTRPLIFAVIQGGDFKDLREFCAQELLKIGFDGFAFGGFPMKDGAFDHESLKMTAELIPSGFPKFALGVGTPQDIVDGFKMGYDIFDCVLPTRDGRHQRIYNLIKAKEEIDIHSKEPVFRFLGLTGDKFLLDEKPLSEFCDCLACQNYTRAYIKHLFDLEEFTAGRLSSIHNLRTYSQIIEVLRKTLDKDI